jgi:hypothetical protein
MRAISGALLAVLMAGTVAAQAPAEPPLNDVRLPVSTLVREDLFAGFMYRDMTRFARGEKNLATLLQTRPDSRPDILAWQGGSQVFKAVVAREAGNTAEYKRLHKQGFDTLAEAKKAGPAAPTVYAVTGGVMMLYADKLAPEDRAAAWDEGYKAYQFLWTAQGPIADKLPVHIRGELIAGVAQSAQRTGHGPEMTEALDRMLVLTQGTPYEATALAWKADPKSAAGSSLGCKSCHDMGRLAPTLARLDPKAG